MTKYAELDDLFKKADAFVAGGQSEEMVALAEKKLGVVFPLPFKDYLLKWGNVTFNGLEYYGLTRNSDFENASVPNCVWFTLRKRKAVGLPDDLVIFQSQNDDAYLCIACDPEQSRYGQLLVWDNVISEIAETLEISFLDYLRQDLRR